MCVSIYPVMDMICACVCLLIYILATVFVYVCIFLHEKERLQVYDINMALEHSDVCFAHTVCVFVRFINVSKVCLTFTVQWAALLFK